MDKFTRKIAFIWLKCSELLVNSIIWAYAQIYSKKNKATDIHSIGAYWNLPPDLTGSNLRMGNWKHYFEKDGISYTNLHINQFHEYVEYVEKGTWTQRYTYFAKCLWRRLPQLLKAHQFDTIWIDRGLIPFYPRKNAFIEKQIKKVVSKVVIDTTDGGDYQSNPELMEETFRQADKLTVGYKYLKEIYSDRFDVSQIFWTIPKDGYIIKTDYSLQNPPVIGWMGSPGNFEHILGIKEQLVELNEKSPFILRYICRKNFDAELEGITCEHHFFGDDYKQLLSTFDIGISPFLKNDLRSKGKIAMKHQEFLLMGTPQACSPVALSEFVVHGEHAMIVNSFDQWSYTLEQLLSSINLREKLGANSTKLFAQNYSYESQLDKLKFVLTNS